MKFVGREQELRFLEERYSSDSFQLVIIYGRRRIGKTSLINHFIKDKTGAIFTARESSAKENLAALSKAILSIKRHPTKASALYDELNSEASSTMIQDKTMLDLIDDSNVIFGSFQEAFEYLFKLAREQEIVFAIDEYPYLAESDRSISSLLQSMIDKEKDHIKLYLILCGSSMSFMEHQVLGYKSPLYGRRTAQIKVLPFDIFQAAELLQGLSAEDLVSWYGITGGVPVYLEKYDQSLSLEQNIAHNIMRPDCFLFGEPDSFLQQELREPARYNAVVWAIASGNKKLTDIANAAGMDRTAVGSYLDSLIELGIITKEHPVIDKNRKKVRYRISDNLFRFWYSFIPKYLTPILAGRYKEVAARISKEQVSTFLGRAFEDICRQWLLKNMETKDIPFILDIGGWWGTDKEKHEEADLDIIAICDDDSVIFGECKWRNKPTGSDVLKTLVRRSGLFKEKYKEQRLFIFSKNGFTETCQREAEKIGCTLISLDELAITSHWQL